MNAPLSRLAPSDIPPRLGLMATLAPPTGALVPPRADPFPSISARVGAQPPIAPGSHAGSALAASEAPGWAQSPLVQVRALTSSPVPSANPHLAFIAGMRATLDLIEMSMNGDHQTPPAPDATPSNPSDTTHHE